MPGSRPRTRPAWTPARTGPRSSPLSRRWWRSRSCRNGSGALGALQALDYVGAGPAGYWGVSLGCGLGVPFVAAEPRVRAAVLGLGGAFAPDGPAARITVPVLFLVQWDDERVPRAASLALFDALASAEKTLHASPGRHGEVPPFEQDSALRFFTRHLR